MIKFSIALIVLAVMPFSNLFAQTNPSSDFIQNYWTYKEYSKGNVEGEVEKSFRFDFKEDGNGYLMVMITCTIEEGNSIVYFGNVGFSYSISADSDDPSRTSMEVTYGELSFEPIYTGGLRNSEKYDESVKLELMSELSNKTVDYYLQRTGQYLILEGFEQNEQSQFTYFTTNPTRRD